MRGRVFAAALMAFLALASLASGAAEAPPTVTRGIALHVPAVSGSRGEILGVVVTVSYPGTGKVEVRGGGEIGPSTVYSARMAVMVASLLLGVDWSSVDVSVDFASYGGLKGPSASFALALATLILLSPLPPRSPLDDYSITGAITPEGLSARVGGVPEKCAAAEEAGLKTIAPLANIDALLTSECESAEVVTGLLEAAERVAGLRLYYETAPIFYPSDYAEVMKKEALRMTEYARGNLSEAEALGPVNETEREIIESRIELALRYAETHPYSAASFAFTALMNALTVKTVMEAGDSRGYVEDLINRVESMLEEARSMLPRNASTWPEAELLSVAYTRAADAEASLIKARQLLADGRVADAASEAAYAYARLETIRSWGAAASTLADTGPAIDEKTLDLLASRLDTYTHAAVNYTLALLDLLEETVGSLAQAKSLVTYLYDRGRQALQAGQPLTAIGYYRETLSLASYWLFYASLGRVATPGVVDGYMTELFRLANHTLSLAASRGVYSVLASSYLEYARVLAREASPLDSVRILEAAVASAEVALMLTLAAPSYLHSTGGLAGTPPGGSSAPPAVTVAIVAISGTAVAFAAGYALGVMTRLKKTLRGEAA